MVFVMTSPQPLANHKPPPPHSRLGLNFEAGQLKKRIHLFEGLSSDNGSRDEAKGRGESGERVWCRQPKVISPQQKRWTQLDVTNDEPQGRKDISRQRAGQQTMHHGGLQRGPRSPGPKPVANKSKNIEAKSSPRVPNGNSRPLVVSGVNGRTSMAIDVNSKPLTIPDVNGKPLAASDVSGKPLRDPDINGKHLRVSDASGRPWQPLKRDRSTGGSRKQRDESVRNSVLAIVNSFEHGNSSVNATDERHSKMLTVPEGERERRKSESSDLHSKSYLSVVGTTRERTSSESSGHGSSESELKRRSKCLMTPATQNRKSRTMDSLVQEFESVACEMTQDNSAGTQTPLSNDKLPEKPPRTYEQDIYNESKAKEAIRKATQDLCRKSSMKRIFNTPHIQKQVNTEPIGECTEIGESDKRVPRTFDPVEAQLPDKYRHSEGSVPQAHPSKNCNHNGGEEDEMQTLIVLHHYAQLSPPEDTEDPEAIDNNNRSSFIEIMKSPGGIKPRVPSSSSPAASPTGHNKPSFPPPPPPPGASLIISPEIALVPPPGESEKRMTRMEHGNIGEERARQFLPPHTTLQEDGSISPGTMRRMTDSALIPGLSPRTRRKDGTLGPLNASVSSSAIMGEYAEPMIMRRSWSQDSVSAVAPTPVVDSQGYSVPGSHLWMRKSSTLKPKSSAKLVLEQRPHLNTISQPILRRGRTPKIPDQPGLGRSRDNNKKGKAEDESAATTRGEGVSGHHHHGGGKKEGFRQRSKLLTMRRKINDAFRRKHHQQKTEEDRISMTSEGSDSEVNDQVLKKRLTYVRNMRLRSSVYCTVQPRFAMQYSKLYEYAVIVSLKVNEERRYEPYEIRRFPHEVSDSQSDKLRAIPHFCFPDAFKWAPIEQYNSESFCFVLTSSDGSRLYGYNRRMLPPGKGPRLPEVVCVMSPIGCYPIYNQLLDEVENRRASGLTAVENLLKLAYDCPFPRPGSHSKVVTPPPSSRRKNLNSLPDHKPLVLQRPQDQRLEHVDFDTLFNCLSVQRIVQIFASLLLERRVIMCSGKLSKLSRCSQALAGLLYPFSWQHVYVPVLPEKLIDMCCSPTPYIMGMLSLCIPRLEEMPLEEVLVVDLDARNFYTVIGDEETILPKKLTHALERALKVCSMSSWEGADTDDELSEDHESKNSAISEAFIRFFVETVGHYSNHFTQQFDGSQKFDRDGFVKAVSSKSVRNFLEVFSETQMFSLFIQEKESESEGISQGLFERRVKEYESETKSNSKNISAKMKKIGKAVKEIKDSAKGVQKRMKQNLDDKI